MKRWEWYSSLSGTFFTAASYSFATNSAVLQKTQNETPSPSRTSENLAFAWMFVYSRRCISLYSIVSACSELSSVGSRVETSWARVNASSCFPVLWRPIAFRTWRGENERYSHCHGSSKCDFPRTGLLFKVTCCRKRSSHNCREVCDLIVDTSYIII